MGGGSGSMYPVVVRHDRGGDIDPAEVLVAGPHDWLVRREEKCFSPPQHGPGESHWVHFEEQLPVLGPGRDQPGETIEAADRLHAALANGSQVLEVVVVVQVPGRDRAPAEPVQHQAANGAWVP